MASKMLQAGITTHFASPERPDLQLPDCHVVTEHLDPIHRQMSGDCAPNSPVSSKG